MQYEFVWMRFGNLGHRRRMYDALGHPRQLGTNFLRLAVLLVRACSVLYTTAQERVVTVAVANRHVAPFGNLQRCPDFRDRAEEEPAIASRHCMPDLHRARRIRFTRSGIGVGVNASVATSGDAIEMKLVELFVGFFAVEGIDKVVCLLFRRHMHDGDTVFGRNNSRHRETAAKTPTAVPIIWHHIRDGSETNPRHVTEHVVHQPVRTALVADRNEPASRNTDGFADCVDGVPEQVLPTAWNVHSLLQGAERHGRNFQLEPIFGRRDNVHQSLPLYVLSVAYAAKSSLQLEGCLTLVAA